MVDDRRRRKTASETVGVGMKAAANEGLRLRSDAARWGRT